MNAALPPSDLFRLSQLLTGPTCCSTSKMWFELKVEGPMESWTWYSPWLETILTPRIYSHMSYQCLREWHGPLGQGAVRGDLSCQVSTAFSRRHIWVNGGTNMLFIAKQTFGKEAFFCFFKPVTCNVLMKEERPALHQTSIHTGCQPASAGTVVATDKSSNSLHYHLWLPTSINYSVLSTILAVSYSLC